MPVDKPVLNEYASDVGNKHSNSKKLNDTTVSTAAASSSITSDYCLMSYTSANSWQYFNVLNPNDGVGAKNTWYSQNNVWLNGVTSMSSNTGSGYTGIRVTAGTVLFDGVNASMLASNTNDYDHLWQNSGYNETINSKQYNFICVVNDTNNKMSLLYRKELKQTGAASEIKANSNYILITQGSNGLKYFNINDGVVSTKLGDALVANSYSNATSGIVSNSTYTISSRTGRLCYNRDNTIFSNIPQPTSTNINDFASTSTQWNTLWNISNTQTVNGSSYTWAGAGSPVWRQCNGYNIYYLLYKKTVQCRTAPYLLTTFVDGIIPDSTHPIQIYDADRINYDKLNWAWSNYIIDPTTVSSTYITDNNIQDICDVEYTDSLEISMGVNNLVLNSDHIFLNNITNYSSYHTKLREESHALFNSYYNYIDHSLGSDKVPQYDLMSNFSGYSRIIPINSSQSVVQNVLFGASGSSEVYAFVNGTGISNYYPINVTDINEAQLYYISIYGTFDNYVYLIVKSQDLY